MITIAFLAFVALAGIIAIADWRRGWYLAILTGVLQDPVRKLTPGTPVAISFSIIAVYAAMIAGTVILLGRAAEDFNENYRRIRQLSGVFFLILIAAAINGLVTFGLGDWEVPALGLFIYLVPVPAVLLGYAYYRNEEDVLRLFRFFAIVTSIALVGVPLEYLRVDSNILGTVALGQDWIRHFPGIQIRILSGTYRSPDIMAWHAAMVCIFGLILMFRRGFPVGWLWMAVSAWGFFCALMSGRRKMLYMIAIFAAIFILRHVKRLSATQLLSLAMAGTLAWGVVEGMGENRKTNVYLVGAKTSEGEVVQRLEGGMIGAIEQFGIMGLGLGAATQGIGHLTDQNVGVWQEGGLGKLAVELGLPGLLFVFYFGFIAAITLTRLAHRRDEAGQISMTRIALLAIMAANVFSFVASHQAFSDGVLVLMNALILGCLFGSGRPEVEQALSTAAIVRSEAPATALPIHGLGASSTR